MGPGRSAEELPRRLYQMHDALMAQAGPQEITTWVVWDDSSPHALDLNPDPVEAQRMWLLPIFKEWASGPSGRDKLGPEG